MKRSFVDSFESPPPEIKIEKKPKLTPEQIVQNIRARAATLEKEMADRQKGKLKVMDIQQLPKQKARIAPGLQKSRPLGKVVVIPHPDWSDALGYDVPDEKIFIPSGPRKTPLVQLLEKQEKKKIQYRNKK